MSTQARESRPVGRAAQETSLDGTNDTEFVNGITSPDDLLGEVFDDDQVPEDAEIVGENHEPLPIDERLADVTRQYLATVRRGTPLRVIKSALLRRSNEAISEHNAEQKAMGTGLKVPPMRVIDPMQISMILLHRFSIIRMVIGAETKDTMLAIYDEEPDSDTYGLYVSELVRRDLIDARIRELNRQADDKVIAAVYSQLNTMAPIRWRHRDADVMPMANCLVRYPSLEVVEFSPEYVIDRKAVTRWVEDPPEPDLCLDDGTPWDHRAFIDELVTDPEVALVLKQAVIAACRPFHLWVRSLWPFNASGNNGKGTMGVLLSALLGEDNVGALSMANYSETYLLSSLATKMANIADENDVDARVVNSGRWKTIRTGGIVMAGAKYEKDYKFKVCGIDWQPLNHFLKVADTSNSLWRRALPLTFDKEFEGIERPEIRDRLIHDPSYLEWLVWTLAHELDAFDSFHIPASSLAIVTELKVRNDPVRAFWEDINEHLIWDLVPRDFLYDLFKAWSEKYRPSAKGMLPGRVEFWDRFTKVINEQASSWTVTKKVRPGVRMDEPEPLIAEYDLRDWYNKLYQGNDLAARCSTNPKEFIQGGIARVGASGGRVVLVNDNSVDDRIDGDSASLGG